MRPLAHSLLLKPSLTPPLHARSHIADERAPADANRVPDPQDILASVLVQGGRVVGASYEPNRVAYRVVSEQGLMRIPGGLLDRVRDACRKVREVEEEVAREREAGGQ